MAKGKKRNTPQDKARTVAHTKRNKINNIKKELKRAGGNYVGKLNERLQYWTNK